jgi:hypothetical protein
MVYHIPYHTVDGMKEESKLSKCGAIGAKALIKWHSEHPEGPGFKHGATSYHIRRKYSDLRTREGKQLRGIMRDLADDLGELSAGQRLLLDSIRSRLIVLFQISKYADRQPSLISPEGDLLPCLARSYGTYAEGLRRDLETLYNATRRPARVPDLEAYLRAKQVNVQENKP